MDAAVANKSISRAGVEAFCRAYAGRDIEALSRVFAEEIEWTISGPVDILPFCGVHRGKAAVIDLIVRQVPAVLNIFSVVPEAILVDGDQVALLNKLSAKRNGDGRAMRYRVANFLRFYGGKLVKNSSFLDSFDMVEQLLGRSLSGAQGHSADENDLIAI